MEGLSLLFPNCSVTSAAIPKHFAEMLSLLPWVYTVNGGLFRLSKYNTGTFLLLLLIGGKMVKHIDSIVFCYGTI